MGTSLGIGNNGPGVRERTRVGEERGAPPGAPPGSRAISADPAASDPRAVDPAADSADAPLAPAPAALGSILVRLPNWVGDVVMATPLLKGLRTTFPDARIVVHGKRRLFPILAGADWFDDTIAIDVDRGALKPIRSGLRLRKLGFDAAILLPNSFSSALAAFLAGIPRRVGYALDGRGFLLTDALKVRRERSATTYRSLKAEAEAEGNGSGRQSSGSDSLKRPGSDSGRLDANGNGQGRGIREWLRAKAGPRLRPVPMIDYYLKLGEVLGVRPGVVEKRPILPLGPDVKERGRQRLLGFGLDPDRERIIAFNPGAAYGPSKRWLPEYWAELGDRLVREQDARILLLCGPGEEEVLCDQIASLMTVPGAAVVSTSGNVVALHELCGVLHHTALLVTTDSGPRHFGVAAGTSVVVVVGSTHPGYTECDYDRIAVLLEKVECWPCHLRACPIDFRCMTRLTPEKILARSVAFLDESGR